MKMKQWTPNIKNIIVMTGAGISVAAGIPDFRTPGTGLYDNLQKYDLPRPTAVFELDYFRENPKPFFTLAKELFPGNYRPTHVHYFIRLLAEKGLLLRNYTQNVDTLERVAGVPGEKMVEAHGSFALAHCIACNTEFSPEFVKAAIFEERIARCECGGLVKPDIVFFGENLPARFFQLLQTDFPQCDLLLVIGTSLQVRPFATLVRQVGPSVPRVLINREEVMAFQDPLMAQLVGGFCFGPSNTRDIKHLGDCQESIIEFARLLGWEEELLKLVQEEGAKIDQSAKTNH
jgi:NAD-dependent deacetylase sirtuin 2